MGAQVHADQILLLLEQGKLVFLRGKSRGLRPDRLELFGVAEQGQHVVFLAVLGVDPEIDQFIDPFASAAARREIPGPREAEGIQRSAENQGLEGLPVDDAGHPLDEVPDILEGPFFFPLPQDDFHDVAAEALHARKSEADVPLLVDGEFGAALVDVRIENLDLVALAVVHDLLDFFHGLGAGQAGRKELGRMVAFQPPGLVADPGVAGRVGLVEGVLGELLPVFPDLVQDLLRVTVGDASAHELVLERVQDVDLLLSHGLAELVRLALGEVGQLLRQEHDLLLIDGHAVGVVEVLLHLREVVLDLFEPQFPVDEGRDVIHRPRTVEGVHCDEILEAFRMQLLQPGLHALGFKLEDAGGIAASVQLVGRLVIDRDGLDVDILPGPFLDEVQALVDDGQGDEPEEVHFQHADVFDVMTVELRGAHVFARILVLGHADREIVRQVAASDDGRAGVYADLPDAALKGLGVLEHLLGQRIAVFELIAELRDQAVAVGQGDLDVDLFQSFLEGLADGFLLPGMVRIIDFNVFLKGLEPGLELIQFRVEGVLFLFLLAEPVRNHFRQPVRLVDAHLADAGDILDGAFRRHGPEGDDPGDMVRPVFAFHVFVRLAQVFEVHVDIRHGDAVRVEETLEQELVLDRVQIGDLKAVGDDGARGGATSRPDHAAHRPRSGDIVLDDEEIVREAHAGDGLQLEVDSLLLLIRQGLAIALARTLISQVAEEGHGTAELVAAVIPLLVAFAGIDDILVFLEIGVDVAEEGGVDVIFREHGIPVDAVPLDLVEDLDGIGQGLRMVREDGGHLLFALEVFLLGVAQAVRIVHVRVGRQADQPVVDRTVFLPHEVHVVGGDDLDPVLPGQFEDHRDVLALSLEDVLRQPRDFGFVEHHLQVIILPEHPFVPADGLVGGIHVAVQNRPGDLPRHAGGGADEPLVVLLDDLVAHPRLVVHAFDVGRGDDFHQVEIALVVLGQQDEVVVLAVGVVLEFVVVMAGDVDLAAENRLDRRIFPGDLAELLDPVHVTVVRNGDAFLPQLFSALEQLLDGGQAVKDRILGMDMQVDEGHGFGVLENKVTE